MRDPIAAGEPPVFRYFGNGATYPGVRASTHPSPSHCVHRPTNSCPVARHDGHSRQSAAPVAVTNIPPHRVPLRSTVRAHFALLVM